MGSKERIIRLKESTRGNILAAALKIARQDGWDALSMRKIAEEIDYTAPSIYEYFHSKDALVAELAGNGFRMLAARVQDAKHSATHPADQLEAMWMAYWEFAFAEQALYRAMFGIDVQCSNMRPGHSGAEALSLPFSSVIRALLQTADATEEMVCTKYYTCWSVVHGLVSINLVNKGSTEEINRQVLHDAIRATITSMTR